MPPHALQREAPYGASIRLSCSHFGQLRINSSSSEAPVRSLEGKLLPFARLPAGVARVGSGACEKADACYSQRMEWREIMPPVVKPDNVDPKIAHETLLEIIAERKAREERRKSKPVKSANTRRAKR